MLANSEHESVVSFFVFSAVERCVLDGCLYVPLLIWISINIVLALIAAVFTVFLSVSTNKLLVKNCSFDTANSYEVFLRSNLMFPSNLLVTW